jgi:hypothetical protein
MYEPAMADTELPSSVDPTFHMIEEVFGLFSGVFGTAST